MEEDGEDAERTDEAHEEQEETEERVAQSTVVSELVIYHLAGHHPANEDAGEETYDGQEYLTSDEVKEVEERHSQNRETVIAAQRQRTEHTDERGRRDDEQGGIATRDLQLFMTERRSYFYERHQRREGGKG